MSGSDSHSPLPDSDFTISDPRESGSLVEVLLGIGLNVEVLDEIGDIVVIVVVGTSSWPLLALLDGLVGLGELAK